MNFFYDLMNILRIKLEMERTKYICKLLNKKTNTTNT